MIFSVRKTEDGTLDVRGESGLPLPYEDLILIRDAVVGILDARTPEEINEVFRRSGNEYWERIRSKSVDRAKPKQRRPPIDGYVYLIEQVGGIFHKIGASINVARRFDELQKKWRGDFGPIKIAHAIKTSDQFRLEKELHDKYSSKRQLDEWFLLDEADVSEIMLLTEVNYGADALRNER